MWEFFPYVNDYHYEQIFWNASYSLTITCRTKQRQLLYNLIILCHRLSLLQGYCFTPKIYFWLFIHFEYEIPCSIFLEIQICLFCLFQLLFSNLCSLDHHGAPPKKKCSPRMSILLRTVAKHPNYKCWDTYISLFKFLS